MAIRAADAYSPYADNYYLAKEHVEKYQDLKEHWGAIVCGFALSQGWVEPSGNELCGTITSGLPGGVELAPLNYDNYNYISDYEHPIVTGELTDNTELTDNDLYSNYCSHREFDESTLPAGSRIILRSKKTNNPTLVEYPYGKGKIIASGLTWEHNCIGFKQYGRC